MSVRLWSKLPQIERQVPARAAAIIHGVAQDIEGEAKQNAPVDTGDMRDSIAAEQTGPAEAKVEVGEFYGHFVELGTRKMAARPFLVPAAEKARRSLNRKFRGIA